MDVVTKVLVESNDLTKITDDNSSTAIPAVVTIDDDSKTIAAPVSAKENLAKDQPKVHRIKQLSLLEMMTKAPLKRKSPSLTSEPTVEPVEVSPEAKKLKIDPTEASDKSSKDDHPDIVEIEEQPEQASANGSEFADASSASIEESVLFVVDCSGNADHSEPTSPDGAKGAAKTPASGKRRGRKPDPVSVSSHKSHLMITYSM